MSKFTGVILGGLEIIAGIVLIATPAGGYLIAAGIGTVLAGIGTLLSQGPLTGTATLSRNPVAPWNVVYGRQKLGGILVHISEFDDSNKYLDLVIMLACHASEGNVVLLFDGQRVRIDGNGCSFTPTQQTISFVSVTRANGVVTAVLSSPITDLTTDDTLQIQNVSDHTFNGKYPVTVIDSVTFTYICGGMAGTVSGSGQALTVWPNYKAKIHMEVLLGDHTATFPGMISGTPYDGDPGNLVTYSNNPWTANHKLLGKTSVFLRLHYNDEIFANGLPTIAFRMSGKKDIYDPRTSPASYGYSENSALCIADYLAHPVFGFNAAYGTEIPIDRLIAAANICDEPVDLASGGTEPRYTCNGGFPLTLKRGEVLQNLLTSCGGRLTYTQGQFAVWPAAWQGTLGTAPTLAIAAAGPFRWKPKVAIRDLFNGVKGTYVSPANNWQSSDIPPYAQDIDHGYMSGSPMVPFGDANLAADLGERRWLDVQLPFTISVSTAQRLCKIELMRRRQQGTGTFTYNMAMYGTTALDVIPMTLPLFNWTGKNLEIAAHRFTSNQQDHAGNPATLLGTEIDVQETDPSIYDWSPTEELTAQGFQRPTLPGSIDGGGSTLISHTNYADTPAISLSQPDATHIALAAVSVQFANSVVTYNARSIVISAPSVPTWYYITIADPEYTGDPSPVLAAYAENTTAKVGVAGYTYMGAILALPAGSATQILPGGWPAPSTVQTVP